MTPGKKQTFEPTGLIPRSIVRTFERFYKQLLPKTKYSAIREYRISRYQVLVSIRCLCTLLVLPLVTRVVTNWLIFSYALPQIKYFWDVTYQDEHVFSEIDQFSQVLFFDSLLDTLPCSSPPVQNDDKKVPFKQIYNDISCENSKDSLSKFSILPSLKPTALAPLSTHAQKKLSLSRAFPSSSILPTYAVLPSSKVVLMDRRFPNLWSPSHFRSESLGIDEVIPLCLKGTGKVAKETESKTYASTPSPLKTENEGHGHRGTQSIRASAEMNKNLKGGELSKSQPDKALQNKIFELAESSHLHALQSVTNVFADFFSILVLIFLLITLKPEITILKSFLVEVIYNLSDTTKSFLLILMTDLLVGFHSPRGWETMFSLILHHFGLPENQDFVFLFVATLPVILDTVFKYWIFRHLNKISPSTVATYHNMIE